MAPSTTPPTPPTGIGFSSGQLDQLTSLLERAYGDGTTPGILKQWEKEVGLDAPGRNKINEALAKLDESEIHARHAEAMESEYTARLADIMAPFSSTEEELSQLRKDIGPSLTPEQDSLVDKSIARLRTILVRHPEKIYDLRQQLKDPNLVTRRAVTQARDDCKRTEAALRELATLRNTVSQSYQHVQREMDVLRRQLSDLQKNTQRSDSLRATLAAELEKIKTKRESLTAKQNILERQETAIHKLTEQKDQLQEAHDRNLRAQEALQQALDSKFQELSSMTTKHGTQVSEAKAQKTRFESLERELGTNTQQLDLLQQSLEAKTTGCNQLETALKDEQHAHRTTVSQLQHTENSIHTVKGQLRDKDAAYDQIKEQLEKKSSVYANLQDELQSEQIKCQKAIQELHEVSEALTSSKSDLEIKSIHSDGLQKQIKSKAKELFEKKLAYTGLHDTNQALATINGLVGRRVQAVIQQRDALATGLETKSAEFETVVKHSETKDNRISSIIRDTDLLQGQLRSKSSRISSLKEELKTLKQDSCIALQSKGSALDGLQAQFNKLRDDSEADLKSKASELQLASEEHEKLRKNSSKELRVKSDELSTVRIERDTARTSLQTEATRRSEAEQARQTLSDRNADIASKLTVVRKDRTKFQHAVNIKDAAVLTARRGYRRLSADLETASIAMMATTERFEELQIVSDHQASELSEVQKNVNRLSETVVLRDEKIAELASDNATLRRQVCFLKCGLGLKAARRSFIRLEGLPESPSGPKNDLEGLLQAMGSDTWTFTELSSLTTAIVNAPEALSGRLEQLYALAWRIAELHRSLQDPRDELIIASFLYTALMCLPEHPVHTELKARVTEQRLDVPTSLELTKQLLAQTEPGSSCLAKLAEVLIGDAQDRRLGLGLDGLEFLWDGDYLVVISATGTEDQRIGIIEPGAYEIGMSLQAGMELIFKDAPIIGSLRVAMPD